MSETHKFFSVFYFPKLFCSDSVFDQLPALQKDIDSLGFFCKYDVLAKIKQKIFYIQKYKFSPN